MIPQTIFSMKKMVKVYLPWQGKKIKKARGLFKVKSLIRRSTSNSSVLNKAPSNKYKGKHTAEIVVDKSKLAQLSKDANPIGKTSNRSVSNKAPSNKYKGKRTAEIVVDKSKLAQLSKDKPFVYADEPTASSKGSVSNKKDNPLWRNKKSVKRNQFINSKANVFMPIDSSEKALSGTKELNVGVTPTRNNTTDAAKFSTEFPSHDKDENDNPHPTEDENDNPHPTE